MFVNECDLLRTARGGKSCKKPLRSFTTSDTVSGWSQEMEAFCILSCHVTRFTFVQCDQLSFLNCRWFTLICRECCTTSTSGLFPDTCCSCLTVLFFFFFLLCFWLSQQPVRKWRGLMCVLCRIQAFMFLFLWLEPVDGSSAEAYISSVKLLSEKREGKKKTPDGAACSSFVDQLQRDPDHPCPGQTSLFAVGHDECWAGSLNSSSAQSLPSGGLLLLFLFIAVPLRESGSRDGPTVLFKLPWQMGLSLTHPSSCQSVIICSMLEHEVDGHLVCIWNTGSQH